ncbi:MAG: hypothetical protein P8130_06480, partial [Deltaproteobacteria bacterium]
FSTIKVTLRSLTMPFSTMVSSLLIIFKGALVGIFCSCNMEWRGSQIGDRWEDCQCTPEVTCTECNGTGFVGED